MKYQPAKPKFKINQNVTYSYKEGIFKVITKEVPYNCAPRYVIENENNSFSDIREKDLMKVVR